jgi:hypothetical protein
MLATLAGLDDGGIGCGILLNAAELTWMKEVVFVGVIFVR